MRYQPAASWRSFRCLGAHLLKKPLNCKWSKFVLVVSAKFLSACGHTTPVAGQRRLSPKSICRPKTSPGCRFVLVHGSSVYKTVLQENKKPCLPFSKQGGEIFFRSLESAYSGSIQITFELLPNGAHGYSQAKRTTAVIPAIMTCRFRDSHRRPTRG